MADLPLAIAGAPAYGCGSPSFARHLPVTEGNETLPPHNKELLMFRLTEWIVTPVVVPVFLGLLILGAAALHG